PRLNEQPHCSSPAFHEIISDDDWSQVMRATGRFMANPTAADYLARARKHLTRVLAAWDDPTDWDDLTIYGFYCLEAAVMAAAIHAGMNVQRNHAAKAAAAKQLSQNQGLPDVSLLLRELNSARKSQAYGDSPFPSLNAEDIARDVESFVD